MKKIVLFLLAIGMLLGLSSCGFLLETESSVESVEESKSFFEGFENIFADSKDEQSEHGCENDESNPEHMSSASSEKSDEKDKEESKEAAEQMVWIPKSGSIYHSNAGCSNMKDPTQVTKSEAEAMGYTPCKRCH